MNVYYLNDKGKYFDQLDSATFLRIVKLPDSGSVLYNVFEYYKSGKNKLISKSSKIDPPNFEGQCVTFYESGRKRSTSFYKNGRQTGNVYEYYPNGKIYRVISYPERDPESTDDPDYQIIVNQDSLGKIQVTDGNGYYKGFNTKFQYIDEEGPVKSNKRDSIWKGKDVNQKITFEERYNSGIFVSGIATDSTGQRSEYLGSRSVAPQFKGGTTAFSKYLASHIIYPDYARANDTQGVVVLSFIVEKDGKINSVKVNKSVERSLDDEAVRVLKHSPVWKPGTLYGKPVRVMYSVPLNFALQ